MVYMVYMPHGSWALIGPGSSWSMVLGPWALERLIKKPINTLNTYSTKRDITIPPIY